MLFCVQLYIQFIIFFMQNIKRLPFLVNQKKKKNWGLFKGLSKCCLYMYPDRKIVVAQIWPISDTFIWPAYLLQLTKCHHFMGKWARWECLVNSALWIRCKIHIMTSVQQSSRKHNHFNLAILVRAWNSKQIWTGLCMGSRGNVTIQKVLCCKWDYQVISIKLWTVNQTETLW